MRFGMSDKLGPIMFGSEHSDGEVFLGRDFSNDRNYSEETAALIDGEIKRIVEEAYANAEKILNENREKLDFIAQFLVKNETMDDVQFKAAMDGNPTMEELEAMTEEKRRRSEEENEARRVAIEKEKAEREAKEAAERTEQASADPEKEDYSRSYRENYNNTPNGNYDRGGEENDKNSDGSGNNGDDEVSH